MTTRSPVWYRFLESGSGLPPVQYLSHPHICHCSPAHVSLTYPPLIDLIFHTRVGNAYSGWPKGKYHMLLGTREFKDWFFAGLHPGRIYDTIV